MTQNNYKKLLTVLWALILLMGAWQTWDMRHSMSPDGRNYIEMGDAFFRGDMNMIANAYWSPLYPVIIGFFQYIIQPQPFYKFALLHGVNFLIFIFALFAFHVMLKSLIKYYHLLNEDKKWLKIPDTIWIVLGYALFIWGSIFVIKVNDECPDMLVSGLIYLAISQILKIKLKSNSWMPWILLGVFLGLAYWAKAYMFITGFILILLTFFAGKGSTLRVIKVFLTLILFFFISLPWIHTLSSAKGRITFGDSGRLNYAWYVNKTQMYLHWQGNDPKRGIPEHTTRQIHHSPDIYEFAEPVGGSWPAGYDPTYWYEGVQPFFNLGLQVRVIEEILLKYFNLIAPTLGIAIVGFLILASLNIKPSLRRILSLWWLLVPSIFVLGMFALVHVEDRMIAPWIVILGLGLFAGICVESSKLSPNVIQKSGWIISGYIVLMILFPMLMHSMADLRECVKGRNPWPHPQMEIVNAIQNHGIQERSRIALIGNGYDAYWAYLANIRIISEMDNNSIETFKAMTSEEKKQMIEVFKKTDAKYLISKDALSVRNIEGWTSLSGSSFAVYPLN